MQNLNQKNLKQKNLNQNLNKVWQREQKQEDKNLMKKIQKDKD